MKHIDWQLHSIACQKSKSIVIKKKSYFITITMDKNSNFENLDNLNVQQLREELEWLKLEKEDLKRKIKFQKRRHEELIAFLKSNEEG